MTARAKTSSGPKAGLEPTGSHDARHPVAYAIVSRIAIALLLLVIGLLSDTHDTYFNAIGPASLAGGAIVAFFVWRRERHTSFVRPPTHAFNHLRALTSTLTLATFGPRMFGRRSPSTLSHSVRMVAASGPLTPSGLLS